MICQSCGMPMQRLEDHGGGRLDVHYCRYCTDAQGKLKSRDEVRKSMIDFAIATRRKTTEDAETFVDHYMSKMPAWKKGVYVQKRRP